MTKSDSEGGGYSAHVGVPPPPTSCSQQCPILRITTATTTTTTTTTTATATPFAEAEGGGTKDNPFTHYITKQGKRDKKSKKKIIHTHPDT